MSFQPLTPAPLLQFAGIALGLLLAVLLWSGGRGNRTANRWLAGYVVALVVLTAGDLLEETRWVLAWPHVAHIGDWLIFLVGPLLWMYVRRLTMHPGPTAQRWLLHAIPAVLCLALLVPFYLQPAARKEVLVAADLASAGEVADPVLVLAGLQLLIYWWASLVTLRRFRRALRGNFSSLEHRTFAWLRWMLIVNLAMWLLWVAALLGRAAWIDWLDVVAVPFGFYALAFLAVRQLAVFVGRSAFTMPGGPEVSADATAATASIESAPPVRYQRSGLDRARIPQLLASLEAVMQTEKPWLENDLTLGELAGRTGLSVHHLSQLLNEGLGATFFDYVNARRVEEVKRCLADRAYDGQTILAVALEAGFSSKAAFNAAFRQHTGTTPTQFRSRARNPAVPPARGA
ncbi:MAG: helix-turn-helix transcriptional regulator [Gammaproteobacteria bacterium]|nr:helix-turn-helix transcriptional regulator [Gammaproteobacteria bacterium]